MKGEAELARLICGNGCSFPSCLEGDLVAVDCEVRGEQADAVIAAGWALVPEGSVVVPREPTEAMLSAAYAACDEHGNVLIKSGWRAMCIAASTGG